MSAKEIAERYADSMSVDANRELVTDIEDAIREAVAAETERWKPVMVEALKHLREHDAEYHHVTPKVLIERIEILIGTPPATEPPAPSSPQ